MLCDGETFTCPVTHHYRSLPTSTEIVPLSQSQPSYLVFAVMIIIHVVRVEEHAWSLRIVLYPLTKMNYVCTLFNVFEILSLLLVTM